MNKINKKYEILTPNGFKNFNGVNIKTKKESLLFKFSNNKELGCSYKHKIDTPSGYKYGFELEIGDEILAKNEITTIIEKIHKKGDIDLYDLINVDDVRNRFLANDIVVSNCAFVDGNTWDDFYSSIYPTIASARTSRVIIVSTPNGMNHFHEFWMKSIMKENLYHPIEINWWDVPGYGCFDYEFKYFKSTDKINIIDNNNKKSKVSIKELYNILPGEAELHLNNDNFYKIKIDKTYDDFHGINFKEDQYTVIENKWLTETIANLGYRKWSQEFGGDFLTSAASLISAEYLKDIEFKSSLPIHTIEIYKDLMNVSGIFEEHTKIFEAPQEHHTYVMGIDPAKITEESSGDSLAIQIIDTTKAPLRQVGCIEIPFGIHYSEIAEPIAIFGNWYNEAHLFIENNDQTGLLILEQLFRTEDYDNIYCEKYPTPGFRTDRKNRSAGCLRLKHLVEKKLLLIYDTRTISQLSTFVKKKDKYQAEGGYKDDMVMSLIHALYFFNEEMLFEEEIESVKNFTKTKYKSLKEDKNYKKLLEAEKQQKKDASNDYPPPIASSNDYEEHSVFGKTNY